MDYTYAVQEASPGGPSIHKIGNGDSEIFGDKASEYEMPLATHIGDIELCESFRFVHSC